MTPSKAIRQLCLECYGTSPEVNKCEATNCALYQYRLGRKSGLAKSRTKCIRKYCEGCVVGEIAQIRKCTAGPKNKGYRCPLWQYRFGKSPRASEAAKVVFSARTKPLVSPLISTKKG